MEATGIVYLIEQAKQHPYATFFIAYVVFCYIIIKALDNERS